MARSTSKDAQALIHSLRSAYSATSTSLKIIDLYVACAVLTAAIQIIFLAKLGCSWSLVEHHMPWVVYMAIVGSFPFNSFLSGILSCIGTAVLAVCLRIQVNKENKEFKGMVNEGSYWKKMLGTSIDSMRVENSPKKSSDLSSEAIDDV